MHLVDRRLRSPLVLTGLAALLLASPAAAQATIRVPADQPTIQAAIDVAAPGDLVLIAPGQYAVNGLSTGGKELTLRGENGAAQTVLDGQLLGSILSVQDGEGADLRIEGLTFFRGLQTSTGPGAVAISGNAAPTLSECVFDRNESDQLETSGALTVRDAASVTLLDCEFIANQARCVSVFTSGAATLERCRFSDNTNTVNCVTVAQGTTLTVEACEFTSNAGAVAIEDEAEGAASVDVLNSEFRGAGAGLRFTRSGAVRIEGCLFAERPATNAPVLRVTGVSTALVVRDTRFVDNQAQGPAAMSLNELASLLIEGCDFERNSNLGGAIDGGALFVEAFGTALIRRCRFVDNTSQRAGGAAAVLGGVRLENCVFLGNSTAVVGGALIAIGPGNELDHCSLIGNSGALGGAALYVHPATVVRSSLVWSHAPGAVDGFGTGTPVDVQYSLVEGGHPGTGNIDDDPHLVPSAALDFRLAASSPCRDAGAPGPAQPATDFDGDPRLIDAGVDMGADEILEQPYVGTGEDLALTTLVNGAGVSVDAIKAPAVGAQVSIRLGSPGGSFDDATFLLLAEFTGSGSTLAPPVLSGLDLNPLSPQFVIVFDSLQALPFLGGLKLGPDGFAVDLTVPSGLAGLSLYAQGVALGGDASNGVYAVSNAHEIVLP